MTITTRLKPKHSLLMIGVKVEDSMEGIDEARHLLARCKGKSKGGFAWSAHTSTLLHEAPNVQEWLMAFLGHVSQDNRIVLCAGATEG